MPKATGLTSEALEKLGAARLAELLLEYAAREPALKRRLALELAAARAPQSFAAEIRKQITRAAQSRTFVEWREVRSLAGGLDDLRRAIAERVAEADAREAFDLMWRFIAIAPRIYERCDDSDGAIGSVFEDACASLGPLAQCAKADPVALADRVFSALLQNNYGQYDGLIGVLADPLGAAGLERLKQKVLELAAAPVETPPKSERRIVGIAMRGPIYADEIEASGRKSAVRLALQDIADAQGDVDGFIALYDKATAQVPRIAAEIARRLLAAGRADEALRRLDAAARRDGDWSDFDWEDARIEVLDALNRGEEAQAQRLSCFERALSAPHLRGYLKRLADFEDVEAEERALDHAMDHRSVLKALSFLTRWPAVERAARVALARASELNGDHYEILSPAADALAEKHPLAATVLLRAMIDFTLTKGRSSRYEHAARHLSECAALAAAIADYRGVEAHDAYAARIRAQHARKHGFWRLVA